MHAYFQDSSFETENFFRSVYVCFWVTQIRINRVPFPFEANWKQYSWALLINKHERKVGICMISLSLRNCVCDWCEKHVYTLMRWIVVQLCRHVHCTAGSLYCTSTLQIIPVQRGHKNGDSVMKVNMRHNLSTYVNAGFIFDMISQW